jgi:hypothetical protein
MGTVPRSGKTKQAPREGSLRPLRPPVCKKDNDRAGFGPINEFWKFRGLFPWHDVIRRLPGGINPPTPRARFIFVSLRQLEIERFPVGFNISSNRSFSRRISAVSATLCEWSLQSGWFRRTPCEALFASRMRRFELIR